MVSVVNDSCIKCKSCVEVCPVSAFREGDSQLVVDPDTCIDCGVCISECPQEAISNDADADPKWVAFNAEKLLNGRKHNLPSLKKLLFAGELFCCRLDGH